MGIKWDSFKKFLLSRYSKSHALACYRYSRKYIHFLDNPRELETFSKAKKCNVMKALAVLCKYVGCYEYWKELLKQYNIKWETQNSFESFLRIYRNTNRSNVFNWLKQIQRILSDKEKLLIKLILFTGMRRVEGFNCYNLLVKLGRENRVNEYFNFEKSTLEHFKYQDIFIRKTKNLFISIINEELINEIINSEYVSFDAIRRKLERRHIPVRFSELRDFYGSYMIQHITREELDLLCGRLSGSIFLMHYFMHYFSPSFEDLKSRVLNVLEMMNNEITSQNISI